MWAFKFSPILLESRVRKISKIKSFHDEGIYAPIIAIFLPNQTIQIAVDKIGDMSKLSKNEVRNL
ncbi:MAG: hypothetical protein ABFD29_01310 [Anaerolineaceae bacterium]